MSHLFVAVSEDGNRLPCWNSVGRLDIGADAQPVAVVGGDGGWFRRKGVTPLCTWCTVMNSDVSGVKLDKR